MDIAFRARDLEIPDTLRSRTLERVTRLGRVVALERADVCFSEERNPRIAERAVCTITLYGRGKGRDGVLRAKAAACELAAAADRVLEKLRHRLERLRGRLSWPRMADRQGSVHFGTDRYASGCHPDVAGCRRRAGAARGPIGEAKMVTTQAGTGAMTPEEAALEMARLSYDSYCFTNAETAGRAVVYRRGDGDVGLIDVGA